jgi:hypothetical protein
VFDQQHLIRPLISAAAFDVAPQPAAKIANAASRADLTAKELFFIAFTLVLIVLQALA